MMTGQGVAGHFLSMITAHLPAVAPQGHTGSVARPKRGSAEPSWRKGCGFWAHCRAGGRYLRCEKAPCWPWQCPLGCRDSRSLLVEAHGKACTFPSTLALLDPKKKSSRVYLGPLSPDLFGSGSSMRFSCSQVVLCV